MSWAPGPGGGQPQGFGQPHGPPLGFGPPHGPPQGSSPQPPGYLPPGAPPTPAPPPRKRSRIVFEVLGLLLALVLLLLALRSFAGCAAGVIVKQLPPSADAKIGETAAAAIRAEHELAQAPTQAQVQRVERVFGELRQALTKDEAATLVAPKVTVLVDSTVNAFALPGGEVFVLTGLLDRVGDDDDMLRGVLAHELGHAVHRHGMRSVVRSALTAIALALVLGGSDDLTALLVRNASSLDQLSFSRDMETDADRFGTDLLQRAGGSPEGLARFLESLGKQPVPELLSTHPDPNGRAEEIREHAKSKK
jgi:predicted Zn-dependent protease